LRDRGRDRSSGGRRGGRDRSGSRDRGRGGKDDEGDYLARIYKNYRTLYEMVAEESEMIRRHPAMRYAKRNVRQEDLGDQILRRKLKRGDVTTQLREFYDITAGVVDCMNKKYRRSFFMSASKESRRDNPDLDRDETRGRGYDDDRRDRGRGSSRDRDRRTRRGSDELGLKDDRRRRRDRDDDDDRRGGRRDRDRREDRDDRRRGGDRDRDDRREDRRSGRGDRDRDRGERRERRDRDRDYESRSRR